MGMGYNERMSELCASHWSKNQHCLGALSAWAENLLDVATPTHYVVIGQTPSWVAQTAQMQQNLCALNGRPVKSAVRFTYLPLSRARAIDRPEIRLPKNNRIKLKLSNRTLARMRSPHFVNYMAEFGVSAKNICDKYTEAQERTVLLDYAAAGRALYTVLTGLALSANAPQRRILTDALIVRPWVSDGSFMKSRTAIDIVAPPLGLRPFGSYDFLPQPIKPHEDFLFMAQTLGVCDDSERLVPYQPFELVRQGGRAKSHAYGGRAIKISSNIGAYLRGRALAL